MNIQISAEQLEAISEAAAAVSYVDDDKGQACISLLQLDLILQKLLVDDDKG